MHQVARIDPSVIIDKDNPPLSFEPGVFQHLNKLPALSGSVAGSVGGIGAEPTTAELAGVFCCQNQIIPLEMPCPCLQDGLCSKGEL